MPRMTRKAGHFTAETVWLCARLAFALAALLFLAPLTIGQALGSNCENSYRISHSNSDCMHAWWDNSPSSSCWGTKGGAQSFCSNYGEVVGKVDIISGTDITVWLRNTSKWRYTRCTNDTRQISCCIDKSELCKKSQVEMNDDGKIDHYHSRNNTWSTPLVNTHRRRYEHCESYPTSIYCEVDPEGDAFTEPTLCGGVQCTAGHCWTYWDGSDADDSCQDESMSFNDSAVFSPLCTVTADCLEDDGTTLTSSTGTRQAFDMGAMKYCGDGEIKYRWC